MSTPPTLVVIPARGGSKGIPRKNLRSMAGQPLISYAIRMALASRYAPDVVVTSDDDEILAIARKLGAASHRRPRELAGDAETLDSVVYDAVTATAGAHAIVVTVQPTSPLLRTASMDAAMDRLVADDSIDTILSAVEDRHLRWTERPEGELVPEYESRVNRQQLPPTYRETGGFLITRRQFVTPTSRIGPHVQLAILPTVEGIDIDTPDDFSLCEWHLSRRHVVFSVTGHPEVGLGHVFNALTVANELMRYEVTFFVDRESELAAEAISARNYPVVIQRGTDLVADLLSLAPHVVINDRLDTSMEYMLRLKAAGLTVINFEDLGPGAVLADLVVNAIYPERESMPNHYFGARYFCLRPEFALTPPRAVSTVVERVLVTFGGTDPGNFTRKVLDAIAGECRERGIELTAILGMGYAHASADLPAGRILHSVPNMSDEMRRADVVFTSGGRTVFEVASIGTPSIVMSQNEREVTHTFANASNGFVNLGLGALIPAEEIRVQFRALADDHLRRKTMQERMLDTDLKKGVGRVIELIHRTVNAA